jgi:predicted TIM-barrel fold metal-dependent hydrolase
VFHRNVYVHPFWETAIRELVDLLGPGHVLFGSDYPHPEGIAEPLSYLDELEGLGEVAIRKIMSENANSLLGLDAAAGAG